MPQRPKRFVPGGVPTKAESRKRYDKERGSAHERGYGRAWRDGVRREVLIRDLYTCQECGCMVGLVKGDAHVDHKLAKSKGGTDEMNNLQTLCEGCHSRKTVAEDGGFGMRPHPPTHRK